MKFYYLLLIVVLASACKKYQDPAPFTDDRIKTPYCNDPTAVNYNWDFPGIPDNTVCIYPTQIFEGNYFYRDSLYDKNGELTKVDSFPIYILALDTVHMKLGGFCPSTEFTAKATRYFQFTIDSLLGDGQDFCGNDDTISGKGKKSGIADTISFKFDYQIQTDTGLVTHTGTAIKQ